MHHFLRILKSHYANCLLLIGILKSDLYSNFLRGKYNQQNHTLCIFSNVFFSLILIKTSYLFLYMLHYLKAIWHIYYLWRANSRTKLLLTCCDRFKKKSSSIIYRLIFYLLSTEWQSEKFTNPTRWHLPPHILGHWHFLVDWQ